MTIHDHHKSEKGKVPLEPLLIGDMSLPPHISPARACHNILATLKDYAHETERQKYLENSINDNHKLQYLDYTCPDYFAGWLRG